MVLLIQTFLFGCVYQSNLYYIPLFLQNARQLSLIKSALTYIPIVIMQTIFSILSGFYISRFKRYGEVLWVGYGIWVL